MDVSIEIRSEVIEKQLLGFKYKETDGDNLYYNYLGLVDDDWLPMLVNGCAMVSVYTVDALAWSFESPSRLVRCLLERPPVGLSMQVQCEESSHM